MRWAQGAGVVAALALAGCGGAPAAGAGNSATSAAPASDPATPRAGEGWAAFWARRGVRPPSPTHFLDAYAGIRPGPVRGPSATAGAAGAADSGGSVVRAAVRELAGDAYATDHLRGDLVAAGVLGSPGLSGDDRSIAAAQSPGLASSQTTLSAVPAASVVALTAAERKAGLDAVVVVIRLRYGAFTGTYTDGSARTLPAGVPVTDALVGHLVHARLLGDFFYVQSAYDCAATSTGGPVARACATLPPSPSP